jgi:hypothetical protein
MSLPRGLGQLEALVRDAAVALDPRLFSVVSRQVVEVPRTIREL